MIFGGGFVGEFAENTPWIHLDIAGTSDADAPHVLGPKGGIGVMVRTLATLDDYSENGFTRMFIVQDTNGVPEWSYHDLRFTVIAKYKT